MTLSDMIRLYGLPVPEYKLRGIGKAAARILSMTPEQLVDEHEKLLMFTSSLSRSEREMLKAVAAEYARLKYEKLPEEEKEALARATAAVTSGEKNEHREDEQSDK